MRQKLSEMYPKEREEVCNKIIQILQLDADNSFLLSELDANEEKQKAIVDMKYEVQHFFACSEMSVFKPNHPCKRPYLNIARGILRKMDYHFEGKDVFVKKENGESYRTIKYFIFKTRQIPEVNNN